MWRLDRERQGTHRMKRSAKCICPLGSHHHLWMRLVWVHRTLDLPCWSHLHVTSRTRWTPNHCLRHPQTNPKPQER